MTLTFIIVVLCSYLIGAIPMTYLVARISRGIDIRQYGSGHVGSGNLRRTISMKAAVPVAVYDFFKGMIVLAIAQFVFELNTWQLLLVGIAAVAGHNWPVFLGFNGGRGLATSLGVAFYFMPWGIPIFVAIAATCFRVGGTAVPVLIAMAVLPVMNWILSTIGPPDLVILHKPAFAVTAGLVAIFLVLVTRRLTAPKSDLSGTVSTRELLKNRLLYDRDIKDAQTWMYRTPDSATQQKQNTVEPENPQKG